MIFLYVELDYEQWEKVIETIPVPMGNYLNGISDCEKLKFILSGLNSAKYELEWEYVYTALIDYVYVIYKARQMLIV